MSVTYIKFMTPTYQNAIHVGRMARRIHGQDLTLQILIGKIEPDPVHGAIYRIMPNGLPAVRVDWSVATKNPEFATDKYAWERAVYLYDTKPYWIAYLLSWLDYWRTKHHRRVPLESRESCDKP